MTRKQQEIWDVYNNTKLTLPEVAAICNTTQNYVSTSLTIGFAERTIGDMEIKPELDIDFNIEREIDGIKLVNYVYHFHELNK